MHVSYGERIPPADGSTAEFGDGAPPPLGNAEAPRQPKRWVSGTCVRYSTVDSLKREIAENLGT